MDVVSQPPMDHDAISDEVRRFCAQRYYELERSLRPLVDGTFAEVNPGHLNGYLGVLKSLAKLYQADARPHALSQTMPMAKVAALLEQQDAVWAARMDEAVAAAEARVRAELSGGQQISIETAKSTTLSKLLELETRG